MARLPRLVVPGVAHHLVHRTVAGGDAFPEPADLKRFKDALQRSSREHRVTLHAYALRPHEVQLLATPSDATAIGLMMQALARFYVPAFNRRHGRAGALWQGRFRAAPVGGAAPLLACMRYIEGTAAGRDRHGLAAEVDASSAAAHLGGPTDALLAPVPSGSAYWQLGNTPFEREAAYRTLLGQPLPIEAAHAIESTTLKGWAFGTGEFLASLADRGRRSAARAPGRPARRRESIP